MPTIAFLSSAGTMPGSPSRRQDADEHDLEVGALRTAMAARGMALVEIDWAAPLEDFRRFDAFLVGTTWDYQDREEEFLRRIAALDKTGKPLCNPAEMIKWNLDKKYLSTLGERGAPTIPTLWDAKPDAATIEQAFAAFGTDRVVVKRQIGGGAEGQRLFSTQAPPAPDWTMGRPGMIQPFLPAIAQEGEFSFIFIDGVFCHALLKLAAKGDYRIQSLYGGYEMALEPMAADRRAAEAIMEALPFDAPLYARIDMVRGPEGTLLLMEAELIEPYLYPLQGPELGPRIAEGIMKRLA